MSIDYRKIKNILVVRNDRFGEFLLNMPAFRALKETFINARIILIVDPYVRELAESIYFIDEIIEWKRQKHSLWEKLRLLWVLKRRNIDMAIMLNPSKEFNIFTFLAGIPMRVGYDRKWGFLLTHKMPDRKYLGQKHEVEYNLDLVGLVAARTENKTISLKIEESQSYELLKDFNLSSDDNLIALHPWTSDPRKQWPIDNFKELAKRLIANGRVKIVLIGTEEEKNKSRIFFPDFGSSLINLMGRTTLPQLGALFTRCKLLISGDSGPMHLASAVKTPVIALFRNDIAGKTAKRWGPWGKGHLILEKESLLQITVDEVLDKVRGCLNK